MKSYLSLIPISAKVRKRQNRMTMLCIIISVLLVTMIFSMADMVNAAFNAKSLGMTEGMMALLPQVINKAQALGFIMAIVFNVPCTMTVAATFRENHSKKWIALSVIYYLVFSLALAFIFYHIGLLIWH